MNISAEEKIMYTVMKALYDSGIPISFKARFGALHYWVQRALTRQ